MNYAPAVKPPAPGRWRAEGLMFHMPGKWEFVFELRAGGQDRPPGLLRSQLSQMQLSRKKRRSILQHGPWPPPAARDPEQPRVGKPEAIAFGEKLFFEPRLSGTGLGAVRHLPRSLPRIPGRARRAPSACRKSIATRPASSTRASTAGSAGTAATTACGRRASGRCSTRARWTRAQRACGAGSFGSCLATEYEAAFARQVPAEDETRPRRCRQGAGGVPGDAGQRPHAVRRISRRAVRNDVQGMNSYPEAAQRGLKIFVGKGNCSTCHFGPHFTNGEFADTGMPFFVAPGRVDPGRPRRDQEA